MYNRNSTNFPSELENFVGQTMGKIVDEYSFLKHHQYLVLRFINDIKIDARGLLIYHLMGMGKSILAISLAIMAIENGRKVYMIMAKSIEKNMIGQIHKYVKLRGENDPTFYLSRMSKRELDNWIKANFSFVSLNASNAYKQLVNATDPMKQGQINLDNSCVIIDEAHNWSRSVVNGRPNATGIYNALKNAKNLDVFLLTGTPIVNHPYELVPIFNVLGSRKPNYTILPEDYESFENIFIKNNNDDLLRNRILGLVSYARPGKELMKLFPKQKPLEVVKVKMHPSQYSEYIIIRESEKAESKRDKFNTSKKQQRKGIGYQTSKSFSTYKVKSRQISNVYIENDKIISPKFDKILELFQPGKNMLIYSQFTNEGGLGSLTKYLNNHDFAEYGSESNQNAKYHYAMITGNTSIEDREQILKVATSKNNRYGGIIDILLISETGAEGLDVKNFRSLVILEPYWSHTRILQLLSRINRMNSLADLPEEERITESYILLAVAPDGVKSEELTTDEKIYTSAIEGQQLIDRFLKLLQSVSIECSTSEFVDKYCYMCNPDDQILFTSDIENDLKRGNPCKPITRRKIASKKIIYNGVEYRYVDDENSVHKYKVFAFNENLKAWVRMKESDSRFYEIIKLIR